MPLIESKIRISNGHLLVWRLEETIEQLRSTLPHWLDITEFLNISHPQKKREWLASRHLFVSLCGLAGIPFQGIWKSPDGKPFLLGSSAHISLSHSEHYVAAALHFNSPIGIDLEQPREQLLRVAHKFLSPEELAIAGNNMETLCKYWSAKEAAYKLIGERKISFRDHIRVNPKASNDPWKATVKTAAILATASILIEKVDSYFLAVALQNGVS